METVGREVSLSLAWELPGCERPQPVIPNVTKLNSSNEHRKGVGVNMFLHPWIEPVRDPEPST